MNNNKITELKNLLKQVETSKQEAIVEFNQRVKQLFVDHPSLSRIQIRVNNHEFNDGDRTYFEVDYTDSLVIMDSDGNEYFYDDKDVNPIVNAVWQLFSEYNADNMHELMYGDEYETLAITRSSVNMPYWHEYWKNAS
jgi:sulfur carrier protein ThiS